MSRCAVMFGQFGAAADPINLPAFEQRLMNAGVDTILVQHYESQKVYSFLRTYTGKIAIVGASLGAMSAVICAGYLQPKIVHFVGGFQPSDYDPSGHSVEIPVETACGKDVITRAIEVPNNVLEALCIRNPKPALTGGLGHAAYLATSATKLTTLCRLDAHPGDFGEAQDEMVHRVLEALA